MVDATYFDKDYFTNGIESCKSGYDKNAFLLKNDIYKHQANMLNDILKLKDKKVLDLGCARNNLVSYLRGLNINAYGQDISKWTYANSHIKEFHFCEDIQNKIHGENYDHIISFEVFEHLDKPEQAIKNIYDSMVKGGILFCTIGIDTRNEENNLDKSHVMVRSRDFWHKLFTENGFIERKDIYDKFFWHELVKRCNWDIFSYERS
uniref:Putative methyltransferase n=1 Tax=viral metagenome TaxID=1070528 RepID=A0A6M3JB97_9ZZZZ